MQGLRQGMLGDGNTVTPTSRTISVAIGEDSVEPTARVISSSRLLSDGGGGKSVDGSLGGSSLGGRGGGQLATQRLTADSRHSRKQRGATGEKLQHGKRATAGVKPEPVPPHKRPRRTEAGAGSIAGAA